MVVIQIRDYGVSAKPLGSDVMPIPVNVAAKLKRRLSGKEKQGGLAGSYRHLFGVYVTAEWNLRHLEFAGEDFEEVLEEVDAEDPVRSGVGCAGTSALGEPGFSAVIMGSRIYS